MLCYKNCRFHAANASFRVPDGYFFESVSTEESNDNIRLWDPNKIYTLEIRVEINCTGAEKELISVLQDIKPIILHLVSPVEMNGLSGYHTTYRCKHSQYYEAWFDIADGISLLVLIETDSDISKVDVASIISAVDPRFER